MVHFGWSPSPHIFGFKSSIYPGKSLDSKPKIYDKTASQKHTINYLPSLI